MRFRKRPIVIEATQWFPQYGVEGVELCNGDVSKGELPEYGKIQTLEGVMTVSPGDFIITGVKGERYPCKPDIFNLTYERVLASEEADKAGTRASFLEAVYVQAKGILEMFADPKVVISAPSAAKRKVIQKNLAEFGDAIVNVNRFAGTTTVKLAGGK